MRHYILCICALAFSGCCGLPDIGPQAAPAAKIAAQSSQTTHTGCTLTAGMECGGESLFGGRLDLPNFIPLFRSVWGIVNPGSPSPLKTQADPCARVEADPCSTPGACVVPE